MPDMKKPEGVSLEKEGEFPEASKGFHTREFVVSLVVLVIVGIFAVVFFAMTKDDTKEDALSDVGTTAQAQIACEDFVKQELGSPAGITFNTQRAIQDTRFPTHYQVIGSVETDADTANVMVKSFKCDLNYIPESKSWTSETTVAK
jgi:hypothetical protein